MKLPLALYLVLGCIPFVAACRGLGFSKRDFSAWKAVPVRDSKWSDTHLIWVTSDVHRDDPAFGYQFIRDELKD